MKSLISYCGKVTVSQKVNHNKNRVVFTGHNSGDDNLFKLITKFLSGAIIDKTNLPSLIDIQDRGRSILREPLSITATASRELNYETIITAVLYSANMNVDPGTSTSENFEVILTDLQSQVLASIKIPVEIFYRLQSGMQLIITWKLQIANGEEE